MNKFKKIVILGNGFDLAHGAKTNWEDIFDVDSDEWMKIRSLNEKAFHVEQNVRNTNEINKSFQWNDFEKELEKVIFSVMNSIRNCSLSTSYNIQKEVNEVISRALKQTRAKPEKIKCWTNKEYVKEIIKNNENLSIKGGQLIKNELIKYFVNLNFKPQIKKEYKDIFNDALVLSFNYTKHYEGKYFDHSNCIYVHGSIDEKTNYELEGGFKEIDTIKLGTYRDNALLMVNFDKSFYDNAQNKEENGIINLILDVIDESLGNQELIYHKGIKNIEMKNIKNRKLEPTEVIIHGHSLSENDFNELEKNISFLKVEKVKYYGIWNKNEKNHIKKRLIDIFGDKCNFELFNKDKKETYG